MNKGLGFVPGQAELILALVRNWEGRRIMKLTIAAANTVRHPLARGHGLGTDEKSICYRVGELEKFSGVGKEIVATQAVWEDFLATKVPP